MEIKNVVNVLMITINTIFKSFFKLHNISLEVLNNNLHLTNAIKKH